MIDAFLTGLMGFAFYKTREFAYDLPLFWPDSVVETVERRLNVQKVRGSVPDQVK